MPTAERITTTAGTGTCGFSGDGGPANGAQLSAPTGLALDRDRYLAVTDSGNCRVRMVDLDTNFITTVAGNGTCGFMGDGGPATSARIATQDATVPSLFVWSDVAFDRSGNLYIGDVFNCRVRKVDTHGTISTVAGSGATGFACGAFAGDGGPATSARLYHPVSVAVDADSNIFIAELGNCRIRKVSGATGKNQHRGGRRRLRRVGRRRRRGDRSQPGQPPGVRHGCGRKPIHL